MHPGPGGEPHLEVLDVAAADVGDGADVGVLDQPAGELAQRAVGDLDAARGEERGRLGQVAAHRVGQLRGLGGDLRPTPTADFEPTRLTGSATALMTATSSWAASISATAAWSASISVGRPLVLARRASRW